LDVRGQAIDAANQRATDANQTRTDIATMQDGTRRDIAEWNLDQNAYQFMEKIGLNREILDEAKSKNQNWFDIAQQKINETRETRLQKAQTDAEKLAAWQEYHKDYIELGKLRESNKVGIANKNRQVGIDKFNTGQLNAAQRTQFNADRRRIAAINRELADIALYPNQKPHAARKEKLEGERAALEGKWSNGLNPQTLPTPTATNVIDTQFPLPVGTQFAGSVVVQQGQSADRTPIYLLQNGQIMDAQGRTYDKNGNRMFQSDQLPESMTPPPQMPTMPQMSQTASGEAMDQRQGPLPKGTPMAGSFVVQHLISAYGTQLYGLEDARLVDAQGREYDLVTGRLTVPERRLSPESEEILNIYSQAKKEKEFRRYNTPIMQPESSPSSNSSDGVIREKMVARQPLLLQDMRLIVDSFRRNGKSLEDIKQWLANAGYDNNGNAIRK